MVTNEMVEVCLQPIQEKFIKISLLQNFFIKEEGVKVRKFKKVGEIQGNTTGGSVNIDATSTIRRTCSIDMIITDSSFLISEDSKIWIDKWFKVELGVRSIKTGRTVWFDKGIYAIHNPSIKYNPAIKSLHIEGLDLMCTLDGTLGGTLNIATTISAEVPIANVLRDTVWKLGGISKNQIYIEQNNSEIPYDIEKSSTDTVYSILEEIRDLYMDWEIFFDENGRFIYQKIKNRYVKNPNPNYENDVISFRFIEEHDLAVDYNVDYLFDNVKNKITIWGQVRDDGYQPMYELINDDINSPFSIDKNLGIIPFAIEDDKIFNDEQAEQRARYEFYKHNNMNEQVTISAASLYFLDVNQLIEIDKPDIKLSGRFLIDSITIPLSYDGLVNISAHKVYAIE